MAKIVLLCFRNRENRLSYISGLNTLSKRLNPDNISWPDPLMIKDNGLLIGVFNPSEILPIKNKSVCMGNMITPQSAWWKTREALPDGTYALFRAADDFVEIATDITASRTVWYFHDKDIFIASTSQRAIIFFLRSLINGRAFDK